MNLRYWVKEKLPKSFLPPIRWIFKIYFYLYFWVYYAFQNGKAPNPDRLVYEVTFFCNQSCTMCSFAQDLSHENSKVKEKWKDKGELSLEEVKSLADSAKELGVKIFTISGGEPFLRKDIFEIINLVKKNGFTVTVRSNGTLISEEKAKKIVESNPDSIVFSLDGPPAIHNAIRKEKEAFDKLVKAIRFIQEEKTRTKSLSPHLSFNCTVSAANAGHLSEIVDSAGQLGMNVDFTYVSYITSSMLEKTKELFPGGFSELEYLDIPESLKQVNVEELKKDIRKAKDKAKTYNIEIKFRPNLKGDEIHKYFYSDSFVFAEKCLYPWFHLRVNPYGEVNPCSVNLPMGNIRENSLKEIWNNSKYLEFRRNLKRNKLFPKCSRCCVLAERVWSYLPSFDFLDKRN